MRREVADVSISDVAEEAGVSRSTVSCVLSGNPVARIGKETRQRVREVAARLGYRTNSVARSLRQGRTFGLGVLVAQTVSFSTEEVLMSACNAARDREYHLRVTYFNSFVPNSFEAAYDDLLRFKIDGILSIASQSGVEAVRTAILSRGHLPCVTVYGAIDEAADFDQVVVDQFHGAYIATEHLIERGCRRIGFAGGDAHMPVVLMRMPGWRQAMADFGVRCDESLVRYTGIHAEAGERAAQLYLERLGDLPDGIVANDDNIASGLIRVLRRAGIEVPAKVAVVGFNDSEGVCKACDPRITSIRMPLTEIGAAGARRLMDRLDNPGEWKRESIALPCSLVVRESA